MVARALVAEDDEGMAEMLRYRLEKEGYDVVVASSGQHAIDCARQITLSVALVDLGLRGVGGIDVVRAIRTSACAQHASVVVITGTDSAEAKQAAFDAGADMFLVKPILPQDLLSALAPPFSNGVFGTATLQTWLDSEGAVREVIGRLAERLPSEMMLVRGAFESDNDAARKLAHKMRSSLVNLDAKRAASAGQAFEDGGTQQQLYEFGAAMDELCHALERWLDAGAIT
jgi:CheY-like chemotaxis protein